MEVTITMTSEEMMFLGQMVLARVEQLAERPPSVARDQEMHCLRRLAEKCLSRVSSLGAKTRQVGN